MSNTKTEKSQAAKLQAVKGMNDILPEESARWEALEEILRGWLKSYGYRNMRAPVLEQTALFARGIGDVTDIVEKEIKSQFEGCFFTTRYSPGYGDFPLEVQHDFLSALDAQRAIGLYANDAFLLTPMKSVTAVIGVGNKPPQGSKTGCEFCRIKDNCWFRKRGLYCGVSKSAE